MSSIKINVAANFIGRGWKALVNLAFIPIYIKFLGIEAYGLIGVYLSLIALSSLADLGLSTVLNRELARLSLEKKNIKEIRDFVRTVEIIYWIMAIIIGILIILLASPIALHWLNSSTLSSKTVKQAIIFMGFAVSFNFPLSIYSGGLIGLQKQVLLNTILVISETVRSVGTVVVLWKFSPTLEAFFSWQTIFFAAQTIFLAMILWQNLAGHKKPAVFNIKLLQNVWKFSIGLLGISTAGFLLTQVDKIILSKMLSLEMFGYYSLAWTVAAGLSVLIFPILNAVFPRLVSYITTNKLDDLKVLYHKSFQMVSLTILPIGLVLIFFAQEVLMLWTHNLITVENTYHLMILLVIGSVLNGFISLPYNLQLAYGKTKLAFYSNLIAVFILAPLIFILTANYGAIGGATAWVILNSSYVIIFIFVTHRYLLKGEQRKVYFSDIGKPLLMALIIVIFWKLILPNFVDNMLIFSSIVKILFVLCFTYIGTLCSTTLLKKFKIKKGKQI